MGKKVILKEKPDGYTSRYYRVTVGKEYTVNENAGSCYIVKDDMGQDAMIARERFTDAPEQSEEV